MLWSEAGKESRYARPTAPLRQIHQAKGREPIERSWAPVITQRQAAATPGGAHTTITPPAARAVVQVKPEVASME